MRTVGTDDETDDEWDKTRRRSISNEEPYRFMVVRAAKDEELRITARYIAQLVYLVRFQYYLDVLFFFFLRKITRKQKEFYTVRWLQRRNWVKRALLLNERNMKRIVVRGYIWHPRPVFEHATRINDTRHTLPQYLVFDSHLPSRLARHQLPGTMLPAGQH